MKSKIDSRTFLRRAALVASPLCIVTTLILKFSLDKTAYVVFVENDLFVIYAAMFFAALYATVVNPSR